MNGLKFFGFAAGVFVFALLFLNVSWFTWGVLILGGIVILIGGVHSVIENMRTKDKYEAEQEAAYIKYAIDKAKYERDLKAYNAAQAEAAKRAALK